MFGGWASVYRIPTFPYGRHDSIEISYAPASARCDLHAQHSRDSFAFIASVTGFSDQSNLHRWCKQVYGIRLSDVRSK